MVINLNIRSWIYCVPRFVFFFYNWKPVSSVPINAVNRLLLFLNRLNFKWTHANSTISRIWLYISIKNLLVAIANESFDESKVTRHINKILYYRFLFATTRTTLISVCNWTKCHRGYTEVIEILQCLSVTRIRFRIYVHKLKRFYEVKQINGVIWISVKCINAYKKVQMRRFGL